MRRMITAVSVLVVTAVALILFRETREVVALASAIDGRLGIAVLTTLLAIYAACVGVPLVMFLRLPRPLIPPDTADASARERYRARLAERLARNPRLTGVEVRADAPATLERALGVLHERARDEAVATASVVFVSTAVSQSGRLDGLMVLLAQTRMVWRIAHIYAQRPHPREIVHLYANVAATAFVAQTINDLELDEMLEPVLAPVIAGSALGMVPGVSGVTNIVMESILEGAFNAFLTLRVGCIASRYCGALGAPERRAVRRSATAEATAMLPGIIVTGAEKVSAAMWRAVKKSALGVGPTALHRRLGRAFRRLNRATVEAEPRAASRAAHDAR